MVHHLRLFTLVAAAGVALFLFTAPSFGAGAAGAASFSLKPVTFDPAQPLTQAYFILDAQPGTTVQNQVQVGNTGAAAGTVKLYAVDATTGNTSGTVFRSDTDQRLDTGSWTALGVSELTLQPGETQDVPFTVTIPSNARPGQHVGGIAGENTALTKPTSPGALQVSVQNVTVVAVQVNLPGPVTEKVDAAGIAVTGAEGSQALVLSLHNSGTMMLKPAGTLTVTDAKGQQLQNLSLQLDTFLPQTAIDYPVLVEKTALGAGTYQVTLDLTYGSDQHTHATWPLTISAAQAAQVFQPRAPLAAPAAAPVQATAAASTRTTGWPLWPGVVALALVGVLALALGRRLNGRG